MAAARSRPAAPVSASTPAGTTSRPRSGDRGRARPAGRTPESPTGSPPFVPETADAAALAAAFAADFLSWDEADPARRARALAPYTSTDEDLLAIGWSGTGRQRAELALPGTVVRLGAHDVLVHVRVRVTPFRRRAGAPAGPASTGSSAELLPFPAAAPAPAHPHWEALGSYWYELLIPLRGTDGRWRVGIGAVIAVPPLPDRDADPPVDLGERDL